MTGPIRGTGPPNRKRRPGQVAASFENTGNGNGAHDKLSALRAQGARQRSAEIVAEIDRAMVHAARQHQQRQRLLARLALVRKFSDLMENSLLYGDDEELDAIEQLVMPRIGDALGAITRRLSGKPGAGWH
jgi:hypothetical protein